MDKGPDGGEVNPSGPGHVDSGHAVYSISVDSELTGVDPQMLRAYEQRGLGA